MLHLNQGYPLSVNLKSNPAETDHSAANANDEAIALPKAQSHDSFFKQFMSKLIVAKEFFNFHLPKAFLKVIEVLKSVTLERDRGEIMNVADGLIKIGEQRGMQLRSSAREIAHC